MSVTVHKIIKGDEVHKCCILILDEHTSLTNSCTYKYQSIHTGLLYYITKPVLVSSFGLECLDLEDSSYYLLPESPNHIVSFVITLNHRRRYLLHSNTLACVKAEI